MEMNQLCVSTFIECCHTIFYIAFCKVLCSDYI